MKNKSLAQDYLLRAANRTEAIKVLLEKKSYADVVRECQEVVELCLKALLRQNKFEVPRLHDVSDILLQEKSRFPAALRPHIARLAKISHGMRRDRELSFYGSEDLTPSEFYKEDDALTAFQDTQWVLNTCQRASR